MREKILIIFSKSTKLNLIPRCYFFVFAYVVFCCYFVIYVNCSMFNTLLSNISVNDFVVVYFLPLMFHVKFKWTLLLYIDMNLFFSAMNIISSSQCVRLSRLCSGRSCVTMSKLGLHSSPVLAKKVNIIKGKSLTYH